MNTQYVANAKAVWICGVTELGDGRKYYCKRFKSCPSCSNMKARFQGHRLASKLLASPSPYTYHLSLALPHRKSLADQVATLLALFAELRDKWKGTTTFGGVWFLQFLRDGKGFAPHLHAIIVADAPLDIANSTDYLRKQAKARNIWTHADAITLKAVDTDAYRTNVAYYDTRPAHDTFADDPHALHKFARQAKGIRMYSCFGNFHGIRLFKRTPATRIDPAPIADDGSTPSPSLYNTLETYPPIAPTYAPSVGSDIRLASEYQNPISQACIDVFFLRRNADEMGYVFIPHIFRRKIEDRYPKPPIICPITRRPPANNRGIGNSKPTLAPKDAPGSTPEALRQAIGGWG